MPMNNAQRAEHVRNLNASTAQTNTTRARSVAKVFPQMVRHCRGCIEQVNRRFAALSGGTPAEKRTAYFDVISVETDGGLILHDMGLLLDKLLVVANDYRQPEDDALTLPFTDADVTAYLP